ncbi:MAG: carboxypeptidase regulatory-like domain-containing protein [Candidatus Aminicenantes bacterium]|nr:MAG: carboxypeptidase regulatory-like domain-containing protein [Candidatus Aminicenantes bacterium]
MRKLKIAIFAIMCMIMAENLLFSKIYCRVEGLAKNKDTGKGIPNVKVTLFKSRFVMAKVKTDKKGYFAFKKIPPGVNYYIVCKEDNYVSNVPGYMREKVLNSMDPVLREIAGFFNLKEGDIKYFVINLEKGGKIKGKIFQKNANGIKPMTDCFLYLAKEYEETDVIEPPQYSNKIKIDSAFIMEDGEFSFTGLRPSNKYSITFQPNDGFAYQFIKVAEVCKDETLYIDFTFDFEDQTGVKGKVTKDGVPLKSVYISLWAMPDEKSAADVKSDEEGNYWIRMVKPGLYSLEFAYFDAAEVKHKRGVIVKIEANEIKIINIEF